MTAAKTPVNARQQPTPQRLDRQVHPPEAEARRREVFDRRRDAALRIIVPAVFVGLFGFFATIATPQSQSWVDATAYATARATLYWLFLGSFAVGFIGISVGLVVEGSELRRRSAIS